jgi:hypothetical protein
MVFPKQVITVNCLRGRKIQVLTMRHLIIFTFNQNRGILIGHTQRVQRRLCQGLIRAQDVSSSVQSKGQQSKVQLAKKSASKGQ